MTKRAATNSFFCMTMPFRKLRSIACLLAGAGLRLVRPPTAWGYH
jgi:hypothetical protein